MAYPARLEVTTLLSGVSDGGGTDESPGGGGPGGGGTVVGHLSNAADSSTLTPVADTNAGAPPPLFVIADSSKRPKSAGGVGSGRVVPLGLGGGGTVRPNTQGTARLSVSPRPRSSPCIGRRHTRVTPLPASTTTTTTHENSPPDSQPTLLSRVSEEIRDSGKSSSGAKLPKWNRERRKVGHLKDTTGTPLEEGERETKKATPWPASALDGEVMEHDATTPTKGSVTTYKDSKSPLWGGSSPWFGGGMYTVPTINIASESSTPSTQKRWRPYCASSASDRSDCNTTLEHSRYVTERIHHLVTAFSQRASRVKAQITQPPTPSTELSEGTEEPQKPRQRLDSIAGDQHSRSPTPNDLVGVNSRKVWFLKKTRAAKRAIMMPDGMEPQSTLYLTWLFVMSITYVYNAWVIPLRTVFSEYQTADNLVYWLVTDYMADFIYLLDIVVFKSRIKYLDNGFWVTVPSLMRKHYMSSTKFLYDIASLTPLDLLYIQFGPISVFRLPRLLKIHTFWEFFNRLDTVLSSPHAVRVVRTVLNMLFLIHCNTCFYYGFSKMEGIKSNKWVFQGVGNAYIRCFYFATKTATSIGKNPKPENEAEYVYMTCSWLMGVFVFALLIGQIRDIVATATRNQNEYRYVMDSTQAYVQRLNVPGSLQDRVRQWFTYTWQKQKTLDEMRWLEHLPKKMRTDIAISVHIQTLSKVQLFQDCDKALLRDLVLKLFPVLYLPGDYVCKKGEVGKEMYIVQEGQVMVMGGEKGDVVLATLGEGSVFGEISLLSLAGGNRRTANVKSRGFSNLFVLSKADLQATIKDYPEAQEILKKKAKKLIRQNEAREKKEAIQDDENVIIKSRESTPKLLQTVLQVVRPDSYTANIIRRSSRTFSRSTIDIPSSVSFSPGGNWSWTPSPKLQQSSMSLEVPVKYTTRRPSLEVTYNTSRTVTAKTSVSESLPEEDEEFLVVETSEISEDSEDRPPGSPASQHSITLQRRSRSATPQSVFSYTPPASIVSSPTSERPLKQQYGTSKVDQHRPQKEAYYLNEGYRDSESPVPKHQSSSNEKRAMISSPKSSSNTSRYSPILPTRQTCVAETSQELVPNKNTRAFTKAPPETNQSKEIESTKQNSKVYKPSTTTASENVSRPSSAKTKQNSVTSDPKNQQHQNKKHAAKSAGSRNIESSSTMDKNPAPDSAQQVTVKRGKSTNFKDTNATIPKVENGEVNKGHAGRASGSSRKGSKSSRNSDSSSSGRSKKSATPRDDNPKQSKAPRKSARSISLPQSRRPDTNHDELLNARSKHKKSANGVSAVKSCDTQRHLSVVRQGTNLSKHHLGQNDDQNLSKTTNPVCNRKEGQGPMSNHKEHLASSSKPKCNHSQHSNGGNAGVEPSNRILTSQAEMMLKFGFESSKDSGVSHGTSNNAPSLEPSTDGDSYELFFSELTKTMPTMPAFPNKQGSAEPNPSSQPSSASPASSRIYCSAIVHRECTPSPENSPSPFEAKESRL